jgi:hypothetical protein
LILVALMPAGYILYLALNSGELPSNDYWSILARIYSRNGFSTDVADWLSRHNEHVMSVTYIVYALNIIATHGSNIGLTLATWLFALVQLALLVALLPREVWNSFISSVVLVLSMAAFVFTPSAAHNWILGFSGVAWIGANMFVIASIFCLARFFLSGRWAWAACSASLALLASLTYTTALALWPVLCVGLILVRVRWRFVMLYVGLTAAVYFAYFSGYETPGFHPSPVYSKIGDLLLYVSAYLGGVFTTSFEMAVIIGVVGLAISALMFAILLFRVSHKIRVIVIPWFLIQGYILGTAIMAAVGRSGIGLDQAVQSRYATLPALFWIGLIVTMILFWRSLGTNRLRRQLALAFMGIAAVLLIVSMYRVGAERVRALSARVSLQSAALLSVQLGIPDEQAIMLSITPAAHSFLHNIPTLVARGHVPYNKEDNLCAEIDRQLDQNMLDFTSQHRIQGYFDFLDRYADNGARVVGWAYDPDHQVKCIVLVNQEGIVRGFAVPGFSRPDVAQVPGLPDLRTGWIGYVRVPSKDEILTAYLLREYDERWIPLQDSHSFEAPGRVELSIYRRMID